MNIHYSPPHVVNAGYMHSCAGDREDDIWTKVAANVYVIERRFSHEEMERYASVVVTHNYRGMIRNVDLKTMYKPVYLGEMLRSMPGWQDYLGDEKAPQGANPVSWWLRMEFVEPGERIRFPALPSKINMTEWIQIGELRELYSYDGFGFTLRDEAWGRE